MKFLGIDLKWCSLLLVLLITSCGKLQDPCDLGSAAFIRGNLHQIKYLTELFILRHDRRPDDLMELIEFTRIVEPDSVRAFYFQDLEGSEIQVCYLLNGPLVFRSPVPHAEVECNGKSRIVAVPPSQASEFTVSYYGLEQKSLDLIEYVPNND